jgi:hypothetical protein
MPMPIDDKDPFEGEITEDEAQRAAESREEVGDDANEKEVVVPPGEIVPPGEVVPPPDEKIADAAEEHRARIDSSGGLPRGRY